MDTDTPVTTVKTLQLCGLLLLIAACSTSDDNGPDCRYDEAWLSGECSVDWPPLVPPSGIWRGTDSAGQDVLILVSADGAFRFVDASRNQGAGFMFSTDSDIASGFDLVTPLHGAFSDGTTLANCNFRGSFVERQRLDVAQSCVTTQGLPISEQLVLDYDPLYERGSSLAAISADYQAVSGSVLSVAADGELFMQDPSTGCITNGRFRLIDSAANLYNVSLQFESCTGPDAVLNGSSFDGLAFLDDTDAPGTLVIAVIGDVEGAPVSSFERAARM